MGLVKIETLLNNTLINHGFPIRPHGNFIRVSSGTTFAAEVDTHIATVLEFASGAIITLTMSFDVQAHDCARAKLI